MHLNDKGYEVFLPTYLSTRRWSDRLKSLSMPLFPSYLFCRFDINDRFPVLVTPGVHFVVGVGRVAVPVDDAEIAAVRHVIESAIPAQPWPYLKVGEEVRVERGSLEGLTGIVVRERGTDRLILSVTLMMRSISVEMDRSWVRPLSGRRPSEIPLVNC